MARKLGDFAIALVLLLFFISGISYVLVALDESVGSVSGITGELSDFEDSLEDVSLMRGELSAQVDNASDLATVTRTDQTLLLEQRTSSAGGVLNLFSKNILTNFFGLLGEKFNVPGVVVGFVLGLLGVIITLLFVRFFFGENKI